MEKDEPAKETEEECQRYRNYTGSMLSHRKQGEIFFFKRVWPSNHLTDSNAEEAV